MMSTWRVASVSTAWLASTSCVPLAALDLCQKRTFGLMKERLMSGMADHCPAILNASCRRQDVAPRTPGTTGHPAGTARSCSGHDESGSQNDLYRLRRKEYQDATHNRAHR